MMHKEGTQYVEEFDYEKFAELIVRECGNVALDVGASAARINKMERYRGCTDASKLIKQHFGVEE